MPSKRQQAIRKFPRKDYQTKLDTKDTCPILVKSYNFKVNLFASRCQIRKINRTKAQISKYHILESENTGHQICRKILDTHIGLDQYNEYLRSDNVISELSPVLEVFKRRHNRFDYCNKLKYIISKGGEKYTKQKYKNQIHVRLMQTFFKMLLHEIVPVALFGTVRNIKVLRNAINCLLKAVPRTVVIKKAFRRTLSKRDGGAIAASLDMQPLLKRLDISTIQWLHPIKDNTEQWIIILKLLHWFFAQYIIKVLHKYVVLISLKKQWIYIRKDDWCRMQEEFIRIKESTGDLVPWIPASTDESKSNPSVGIYKFIPSSSGLRALFLVKYDIKQKLDDVDIVLRLLQQLYVTYLSKENLPTVANCLKDVYSFQKSTNNHLYYVQCDIQDAFGSIIQEKLYNIIKMYYRHLPIYLPLRTYTLSRPRKSYKNNNQSKRKKAQTVEFLDLKKCLKNKNVTNEKPRLVSKNKLLAKINKLIFQQKVKFNDRLYSIKTGVPQGIPVSPILSEIYYQHMIKELFTVYTSNGFLCKYVDDMLYITENEHYAAEFLKLVRTGIADYNVKFNPNKIETNVGLPTCRHTKIKFLGCNFEF